MLYLLDWRKKDRENNFPLAWDNPHLQETVLYFYSFFLGVGGGGGAGGREGSEVGSEGEKGRRKKNLNL